MLERVSTQFTRQASLIATVLDPRFKDLKTIPRRMRDTTLGYLRAAASQELRLFQSLVPEVEPVVVAAVAAADADLGALSENLFHLFDDGEEDEARVPVEAGADPVEKELAEYAREKALLVYNPGHHDHRQPDMDQHPLAWWRAREKKYPILASLARKYLAIHAASSAVERMFSYTGSRVSKRDANLSDDTLLETMLVRAYGKFLDTYEHLYP